MGCMSHESARKRKQRKSLERLRERLSDLRAKHSPIIPPPSVLCGRCSSITLALLEADGEVEIASNFANFLAMKHTCELCSLAHDCITHGLSLNTSDHEQDIGAELGLLVGPLILKLDYARLEFFYQARDGSLCKLSRPRLEIRSTNTLPEHELDNRRPLVSMTVPVNLPFTVDFVKTCMEVCKAEHKLCNPLQCNAVRPAPCLPTRVLDIGDLATTNRAKLWCTNGARAEYVALSYTWGGEQPGKTVTSNVDARFSGFPLSDLPTTVRDAVTVATCLGIRYLWVDALCIIQDSQEDWQKESTNMGDIYHNTSITIAASRATSSASGFLGPRKHTTVAHLDQYGASSYVELNRGVFDTDVKGGPLYQRAWGMQERVLSPRTLHFTESQIYWECWTTTQAENGEKQWELGTKLHDSDYPMLLAPGLRVKHLKRPDQLRTEWEKMVSRYSGLGLTCENDRLHAIAGLARKLALKSGWTYMHGIWMETMHHGVLWMAIEKLEPLPEVGAPSWSWASRKGSIQYMAMPRSSIATVKYSQSFKCAPDSALAPENCLEANAVELAPGVVVGDIQTIGALETWRNDNQPWTFASTCRFVDDDQGRHIGWLVLDNDKGHAIESTDLSWILVLSQIDLYKSFHSAEADNPWNIETSSRNGDDVHGYSQYFLVVSNDEDGTYRRVGVGSIWSENYVQPTQRKVFIR